MTKLHFKKSPLQILMRSKNSESATLALKCHFSNYTESMAPIPKCSYMIRKIPPKNLQDFGKKSLKNPVLVPI